MLAWETAPTKCVGSRSRLSRIRRRLMSGLGRSRDTFAEIPWHLGTFRSPPDQDGPHLQILPLEGNRIVVRIDTVRFEPYWDCQLIASGTVDANGSGVLASVDGQGRFRLRTLSSTELVMEPIELSPEASSETGAAFEDDGCHGSHLGAYRASAGLPHRQS
jgi:hypothetical protein